MMKDKLKQFGARVGIAALAFAGVGVGTVAADVAASPVTATAEAHPIGPASCSLKKVAFGGQYNRTVTATRYNFSGSGTPHWHTVTYTLTAKVYPWSNPPKSWTEYNVPHESVC